MSESLVNHWLYAILADKLDDLEQYGRRLSVRVYGIPPVEKETGEDVRNKVLKIISDAKIDVPANFVDRAHRIGKVVTIDGTKKQSVIVRFNNFHYRTMFYKARKDIRYGVSFDLTKSRLDLLNKARERIKDVVGIKFAYSDINCVLRVFTESGRHMSFKTIADLEEIISNL